MKFKSLIRTLCVVLAAALSTLAGAQTVSSFGTNHLAVSVHLPRGTAGRISAATLAIKANALAASHAGPLNISTQSFPPGSIYVGQSLPLWTFDIKGTRDGEHHLGVMVGRNPIRNPGTARVPTYIVPLIIRTHTVATSVDPTTFS